MSYCDDDGFHCRINCPNPHKRFYDANETICRWLKNISHCQTHCVHRKTCYCDEEEDYYNNDSKKRSIKHNLATCDCSTSPSWKIKCEKSKCCDSEEQSIYLTVVPSSTHQQSCCCPHKDSRPVQNSSRKVCPTKGSKCARCNIWKTMYALLFLLFLTSVSIYIKSNNVPKTHQMFYCIKFKNWENFEAIQMAQNYRNDPLGRSDSEIKAHWLDPNDKRIVNTQTQTRTSRKKKYKSILKRCREVSDVTFNYYGQCCVEREVYHEIPTRDLNLNGKQHPELSDVRYHSGNWAESTRNDFANQAVPITPNYQTPFVMPHKDNNSEVTPTVIKSAHGVHEIEVENRTGRAVPAIPNHQYSSRAMPQGANGAREMNGADTTRDNSNQFPTDEMHSDETLSEVYYNRKCCMCDAEMDSSGCCELELHICEPFWNKNTQLSSTKLQVHCTYSEMAIVPQSYHDEIKVCTCQRDIIKPVIRTPSEEKLQKRDYKSEGTATENKPFFTAQIVLYPKECSETSGKLEMSIEGRSSSMDEISLHKPKFTKRDCKFKTKPTDDKSSLTTEVVWCNKKRSKGNSTSDLRLTEDKATSKIALCKRNCSTQNSELKVTSTEDKDSSTSQINLVRRSCKSEGTPNKTKSSANKNCLCNAKPLERSWRSEGTSTEGKTSSTSAISLDKRNYLKQNCKAEVTTTADRASSTSKTNLNRRNCKSEVAPNKSKFSSANKNCLCNVKPLERSCHSEGTSTESKGSFWSAINLHKRNYSKQNCKAKATTADRASSTSQINLGRRNWLSGVTLNRHKFSSASEMVLCNVKPSELSCKSEETSTEGKTSSSSAINLYKRNYSKPNCKAKVTIAIKVSSTSQINLDKKNCKSEVSQNKNKSSSTSKNCVCNVKCLERSFKSEGTSTEGKTSSTSALSLHKRNYSKKNCTAKIATADRASSTSRLNLGRRNWMSEVTSNENKLCSTNEILLCNLIPSDRSWKSEGTSTEGKMSSTSEIILYKRNCSKQKVTTEDRASSTSHTNLGRRNWMSKVTLIENKSYSTIEIFTCKIEPSEQSNNSSRTEDKTSSTSQINLCKGNCSETSCKTNAKSTKDKAVSTPKTVSFKRKCSKVTLTEDKASSAFEIILRKEYCTNGNCGSEVTLVENQRPFNTKIALCEIEPPRLNWKSNVTSTEDKDTSIIKLMLCEKSLLKKNSMSSKKCFGQIISGKEKSSVVTFRAEVDKNEKNKKKKVSLTTRKEKATKNSQNEMSNILSNLQPLEESIWRNKHACLIINSDGINPKIKKRKKRSNLIYCEMLQRTQSIFLSFAVIFFIFMYVSY